MTATLSGNGKKKWIGLHGTPPKATYSLMGERNKYKGIHAMGSQH